MPLAAQQHATHIERAFATPPDRCCALCWCPLMASKQLVRLTTVAVAMQHHPSKEPRKGQSPQSHSL